jgi:hypothetical protein
MTSHYLLHSQFHDIGLLGPEDMIDLLARVARSRTPLRVGEVVSGYNENREWTRLEETLVSDRRSAEDFIAKKWRERSRGTFDLLFSAELIGKYRSGRSEEKGIFEYKGYSDAGYGYLICGSSRHPLRGSSLRSVNLFDDYASDVVTLARELYSLLRPALGWVGPDPSPRYAGEEVAKHTRKARLPPGISWANFYGPAIVDTYGRDFLLEAPGYKTEVLSDGGVFYQVTEHYIQWTEPISPSPEEIAAYFRSHPKVKSAIYRPVLARTMLTKRKYEEALRRRHLKPPSASRNPPPRHWLVERAEQLIETATSAVRLAEEHFGVGLDYSPESLQALDEAIGSREFIEEAELDEGDVDVTTLTLGAYVGEVVRRNLGGSWKISDDTPSPRLVGIGGIAWLDPMARVEKRLLEGEEASLWAWYLAIEKRVEKP